MIGTVLVHIAILILLFIIYIHKPENQEEGGVPVMLGNTEISQGMYDPATMTEVDIRQEDAVRQEDIIPEEIEQEMITQTEEPTVVIPPKKKEDKPKIEKPKKPEVNKPK